MACEEPETSTQEPAEHRARCLICRTAITWIDCPTGGWWAHDTHPGDDHNAIPIPVSDTPLGAAVARVDAALTVEADHERAARLYALLIRLSAAEFEFTDGAALVPARTAHPEA
ncbi:hypothetical protein O1Q96_37505 [Streptomyces sp. Qhu-G9]|uniref:hypothetical protein n=1 Tax=Streptomyces sp. Qhu-G9 TaxID=3452799 RepID=UPI0022AC3558|nr:hypothetical protein [Streptomyces aurantiacus]WAU84892.1 hypothetical protein O1Q96_37505 [Streptomyces aurantiacus]